MMEKGMKGFLLVVDWFVQLTYLVQVMWPSVRFKREFVRESDGQVWAVVTRSRYLMVDPNPSADTMGFFRQLVRVHRGIGVATVVVVVSGIVMVMNFMAGVWVVSRYALVVGSVAGVFLWGQLQVQRLLTRHVLVRECVKKREDQWEAFPAAIRALYDADFMNPKTRDVAVQQVCDAVGGMLPVVDEDVLGRVAHHVESVVSAARLSSASPVSGLVVARPTRRVVSAS